jgi:hypothetical protein
MRTSSTLVLDLRVHPLGDFIHQAGALLRQHRMQRHGGEHAADLRVDQRVQDALQGRLPARHGLDEPARVDDAEARVGIHHHALLVAGDDLELGRFVVEQPAVDLHDVLDQRDLGVEAGFRLGIADQGAELADQDLLGRIDAVEGLRQQEAQDGQRHQGRDGTVAHRVPPVVAAGSGGGAGRTPGFSSGSGR